MQIDSASSGFVEENAANPQDTVYYSEDHSTRVEVKSGVGYHHNQEDYLNRNRSGTSQYATTFPFWGEMKGRKDAGGELDTSINFLQKNRGD